MNQTESPLFLIAQEINRAKNFWLKTIQTKLFLQKLNALINRTFLSMKNALLPLHSFLVKEQLICVGGRLVQALIPIRVKHPVILAAHSTCLLAFAEIQLTLSTLRGEFWVLRARSLVRSALHRCVASACEQAVSPAQLMSNLPQARVSPAAQAFFHCSLDYAGLVAVRALSGRGITLHKVYIAVFVCIANARRALQTR